MAVLRTILALLLVCVASRAADQVAADTTWGAVSNALFLASDGDFVSIPSGSNDWAGRLRITKQVTIRGASSNFSGTVISLNPTADIKDSLFLFEKPWSCISNIYLRAKDDPTNLTAQGWLVAFNTNNCLARNVYFTRCLAGVVAGSFSLVRNCTFYNCDRMGRTFGMAPLNGSVNSYNDAKWVTTFNYTNWNGFAFDANTNFFAGTNFMVYENNVFVCDSGLSGRSPQVVISGQQGQMWIARHNYIELNAFELAPAFDAHGGGECCSDYGALCVQIYSNIFKTISGGKVQKLFDQRGGVGTCYSNWIDTAFGDFIHMRNASGTGEYWNKGPQVTNSWHWENRTNNGAGITQVVSDNVYIPINVAYHDVAPPTIYQMAYPDPIWNFFVPAASGPADVSPSAGNAPGAFNAAKRAF